MFSQGKGCAVIKYAEENDCQASGSQKLAAIGEWTSLSCPFDGILVLSGGLSISSSTGSLFLHSFGFTWPIIAQMIQTAFGFPALATTALGSCSLCLEQFLGHSFPPQLY